MATTIGTEAAPARGGGRGRRGGWLFRATRPTEPEVLFLLSAGLVGAVAAPEGRSPAILQAFQDRVLRPLLGARPGRPAAVVARDDGVRCAFADVVACAEFALKLIDATARNDWPALGLPGAAGVRVGLHAGPAETGFVLADRLERATLPGAALVSNRFTAHLTTTPGHRLCCRPVFGLTVGDGGSVDERLLYLLVRRDDTAGLITAPGPGAARSY